MPKPLPLWIREDNFNHQPEVGSAPPAAAGYALTWGQNMLMTIRCAFYFLVSMLLVGPGFGEQAVESRLEKHFSSRDLNGCFVLLDVRGGTMHVWNPDRAKQRFRPASTFKIPNAVIGLEAKVVDDIDKVIPYGGTKELIPAWEKDMSLRDAMKVSNVAVFHQLAKREGLAVIKRYVADFSYGNENVGNDIESRFWLQGPLKISSIEQVEFLARLASGKLEIRPETKELIRDLIRFDGHGETKIYAKTGWIGPKAPQIGWWVGWVEQGAAVYPFALNIDINTPKDAKQRIPIGLDCLRSLGILDAQQGGAGQPATRSESNSEGGDKAQPETEGRSR